MKSLRPLKKRRTIARRREAILDAWMVSLEQRTLLSAILEPVSRGVALVRSAPIQVAASPKARPSAPALPKGSGSATAAPLPPDVDYGDPPASIAPTFPGNAFWLRPNPLGNASEPMSITSGTQYRTFAFQPDVSGSYVITTTGALDAQLRVYNSSGAAITGIIDSVWGGDTESVTVSLTGNSWCYVVVAGYLDTTGAFTLGVDGPNAASVDVATPPGLFSGTASGAVDVGGERDFFRLVAPSGATSLDEVLFPDGSNDTYAELYDAAGNSLYYIDYPAGIPDFKYSIPVSGGATYYLAVGHTSYSQTGSYSVEVDFDPDTSDLDDRISTATALGAVGSTTVHTDGEINPSTDVDMYSFTVTAGQRVAFDVDQGPTGYNVASLGDTGLRLFNSAGAVLAVNDDGQAPGEAPGYESYLEYTFATAGTYYAGISAYPNLSYNPLDGSGDAAGSDWGGYGFSLTTVPDDTDDQISEAIPLGNVSTTEIVRTGWLTSTSDVDMYEFTTPARGMFISINIDTPGSDGLSDAWVRVFRSWGFQLTSNDDGAAPGETLENDSYAEVICQDADKFYIGVSGYGNSTYKATSGDGDAAGAMGSYTLRVKVAYVDPDDQISEAAALGAVTSNLFKAGTIEAPVDVDMYAFTVAAGQRVSFDVDSVGNPALPDSYLRVFNAAGSPLGYSDDAAAPGETPGKDAYLEYTFATAGTYYVGISGGFSNRSYLPLDGTYDGMGRKGSYYLTLMDVSPDPDDRLSTATSLGAISATRTINADITPSFRDVDLYSFTATAGQAITFDIDAGSPGLEDSYLKLFNSSGAQLAVSDDDQAPDDLDYGLDSYLTYTFTAAGTYYVGVSAYPNSQYNALDGTGDTQALFAYGTTGTYSLILSTDWFSRTLADPELRVLASADAADNILNRADMIALFHNAEDGGIIDANELADLRALVDYHDQAGITMPDPVRNLSDKLVWGNHANANYQGAVMGNLAAGSPASRMENLINKWFLGLDHPTATGTYTAAAGNLFVGGPVYGDINQGSLGDCYFLAALAASAARSQASITSMFTDNGDNTWTVRFFNSADAQYVTVDRQLPQDAGHNFLYANRGLGRLVTSSDNELWVALAEKAYAQINEEGWTGHGDTNSYASIVGGLSPDAAEQVLGTARSDASLDTGTEMVNAWNRGDAIALGRPTPIVDTIARSHAYAIVGYDASTALFTVFNPWGLNGGWANDGHFKPGILNLPFSDISANFSLRASIPMSASPASAPLGPATARSAFRISDRIRVRDLLTEKEI